MCLAHRGTVLRRRICPKCHKAFLICSSCDRGNIYCCRSCSSAARVKNLRRYRAFFRGTAAERLNHRDRERARRYRQKEKSQNVGDHTPQPQPRSVRIEAPVLLAVISAVSNSNGGEIFDGELKCSVCGRPGKWVVNGRNFHQIRKIEKEMALLY